MPKGIRQLMSFWRIQEGYLNNTKKNSLIRSNQEKFLLLLWFGRRFITNMIKIKFDDIFCVFLVFPIHGAGRLYRYMNYITRCIH